ncbi:methyltransferase (plasmid) [Streptomyces sp. NBC_01260]|uniref:class I SAM-dependent methyltransferase n=1 Tax=unclassified Streptomyces TaxID=2593676 RepID=UPI000F4A72C3|nr:MULTISPECIES: class I SAM-dependent methyltransferase [unclassified Streptomyces]MCX4775227.1 methyltransferase [Streptomyces sp. NBC_01285]ROQ65358.1 ubiquinone/menaquinone biosynthesis C-methylase UbiE [Streptomyces sp. CEV 2-1]RPK32920.1 Demethylspheroidene O-methyltransferase [Streptomyces sp. ADI92-24]
MTGNLPSPSRILEIASGYWATGLLGVATQNSLFTLIHDGVDTAGRLAEKTGMAERGVQSLLDGLVGLGLLRTHDGTYHNTPESELYLVEGKPTDISGFAQLKLAEMDKLAGRLEVFRAGGPLTEPMVEVADNPHWENVVTAIAGLSVTAARTAADVLGLAERENLSILDVGGGSGIFSSVWLRLNATARATQLDWEPINAIARRLLAQHSLADRFTCLDGDFHAIPLEAAAYDVALYSHVAHQEGPEDNVAVFAKLREALKPGGALVVCDYIVEDDRSGPAFPLLFASEMLLKSNHGGTWRRADYAAWLAEAGFEKVSFHPTASPASLVIAH